MCVFPYTSPRVIYRASTYWNNLTTDLKTAKPLEVFMTKLKSWGWLNVTRLQTENWISNTFFFDFKQWMACKKVLFTYGSIENILLLLLGYMSPLKSTYFFAALRLTMFSSKNSLTLWGAFTEYRAIWRKLVTLHFFFLN